MTISQEDELISQNDFGDFKKKFSFRNSTLDFEYSALVDNTHVFIKELLKQNLTLVSIDKRELGGALENAELSNIDAGATFVFKTNDSFLEKYKDKQLSFDYFSEILICIDEKGHKEYCAKKIEEFIIDELNDFLGGKEDELRESPFSYRDLRNSCDDWATYLIKIAKEDPNKFLDEIKNNEIDFLDYQMYTDFDHLKDYTDDFKLCCFVLFKIAEHYSC